MSHECHGLSNDRQPDFFNSLFRLAANETSKLHIIGFFLKAIPLWPLVSLTKG